MPLHDRVICLLIVHHLLPLSVHLSVSDCLLLCWSTGGRQAVTSCWLNSRPLMQRSGTHSAQCLTHSLFPAGGCRPSISTLMQQLCGDAA